MITHFLINLNLYQKYGILNSKRRMNYAYKNGFLIDPASDTERLVDLRITDGLIQTLADAGTLTPEKWRG